MGTMLEKRSEMRKESVREDHVMTTVEEIQKLQKKRRMLSFWHIIMCGRRCRK